MSRFKENFAALDGKKWTSFNNIISKISEEELDNNNAATEELDRLKLAVEYISSSADSLRPYIELINPDIQNHVKSFENHLKNFQSTQGNNRLSHLNSLNNTATAILERVWPFLSKSNTAKAAGQAFGRYKRLIEAEEESIRSLRSEAETAIDAIRSISADLSGYRAQLLVGTDESISIKDQVQNNVNKLEEMLSKTEHFYHLLTEGDEDSISIQDQIAQAKTSAIESNSRISEKLLDAEHKLEELYQVYSDVVGENSGEENQNKGLKGQLEARQIQLDKMVEAFDDKFNGLVDKVEDLLPGATSAGLASAYNTLRRTAEKKASRYSTAFFALVCILTITAAATITESFTVWPPSWQAITISNTAEYFTKMLFKLPIIIPVVWAALTVSKRRSEMHRLAEEYAHKEALAKSYEGFKKQITELNNEDNKLLAELLTAVLKAVSLNAATTLDGKHGERMPLQEPIEELVKTLFAKKTPS